MKNTILLFVTILFVQSSLAQCDIGRHFIVGYSAGGTSINNAYSSFYNKDATLPMDLNGLNIQKDKFNHTSWMLRSSYWSDNVYIDSELSYFLSLITGFAKAGIAGEKYEPNSLPQSGELKKLGENTAEDAIGYGISAPVIMADIAVGADNWYLGGVWGYTLWGLDDVSGTTNPGLLASRQIYINEERKIMQHLGLSIKRGFSNSFGPSIASIEVNRISLRYKNNEDLKRKGIESKISYKAYTKGYKGLYAEAFYRFQKFKDFSRPANWVKNSNGENGTVPSITTHSVGVNVGFFFDW